ncbi:MAG: twin-arginine translocase TatA/TatE family subunit [Tindallia sp. MSAO_Bac2]|nr:MAG: twin-arginine translocase TatA/TatE family subunit [Tindallia sp. MSAO_Bac2]
MGRIGFQELALVFGLALLIFGPAKLPEIGKSLGKGIREFKSATTEITSEKKSDAKSNSSNSEEEKENDSKETNE